MNLCIIREKILFPTVLHYISWVSLSLSFSLCYLFLIFVFHPPSICLPPPLYRHIFCSYSYNCPIGSRVFKDIFISFYYFPPFPYLGILTFRGVCIVQVVSHALNAAEVRWKSPH